MFIYLTLRGTGNNGFCNTVLKLTYYITPEPRQRPVVSIVLALIPILLKVSTPSSLYIPAVFRKDEVHTEATKALRVTSQSPDEMSNDDVMDTTSEKMMPPFVDMVNYIAKKVRCYFC